MIARLFNSRKTIQAMVLALALFAIHVIWFGIGFNIVMRNYYAGGSAFLNGGDPYSTTMKLGPSNAFRYSPQFALAAGGMARVGIKDNHVVPWVLGVYVLASTTMFALGLCRWYDFGKVNPGIGASICMMMALAAAMMDTLISTGVYQINAFCIGLTLAGLAEYRDGRHATAGALLLLAANIKIYPVVFFAILALRFKPGYWIGALCAGIAAFLIPVFFVGWTHNLNMHIAFAQSLLETSGSYQILDIRASFERVGLALPGVVLHWLVAMVSLAAFGVYGVISRAPDWRPWFACGVAAILLLSPKTEVFTYVFLAPAYVLMVDWCVQSPVPFWRRHGAWLFALCAVLIASARFADPQWYRSESPNEIIRVIGALGIWGMVVCILLAQLWRERKGSIGKSWTSGLCNWRSRRVANPPPTTTPFFTVCFALPSPRPGHTSPARCSSAVGASDEGCRPGFGQS